MPIHLSRLQNTKVPMAYFQYIDTVFKIFKIDETNVGGLLGLRFCFLNLQTSKVPADFVINKFEKFACVFSFDLI